MELKNYHKIYYDSNAKTRYLDRDILIASFEKIIPIYKAKIFPFLPKHSDSKILDLPCGSGNFSYFLLKAGYNMIESVDIDPKQVSLARSTGINAHVADAIEYLKGKSNIYDAIISIDFLEHLDKNSLIKYLKIVTNALKDGGIFIARMPCADSPFAGCALYNDLTHEYAATSGVMMNLLLLIGLKDVQVIHDGPVPYKFINRVRLWAFDFFCFAASLFCKFIGLGSPAIWSPNMWLIGKK